MRLPKTPVIWKVKKNIHEKSVADDAAVSCTALAAAACLDAADSAFVPVRAITPALTAPMFFAAV